MPRARHNRGKRKPPHGKKEVPSSDEVGMGGVLPVLAEEGRLLQQFRERVAGLPRCEKVDASSYFFNRYGNFFWVSGRRISALMTFSDWGETLTLLPLEDEVMRRLSKTGEVIRYSGELLCLSSEGVAALALPAELPFASSQGCFPLQFSAKQPVTQHCLRVAFLASQAHNVTPLRYLYDNHGIVKQLVSSRVRMQLESPVDFYLNQLAQEVKQPWDTWQLDGSLAVRKINDHELDISFLMFAINFIHPEFAMKAIKQVKPATMLFSDAHKAAVVFDTNQRVFIQAYNDNVQHSTCRQYLSLLETRCGQIMSAWSQGELVLQSMRADIDRLSNDIKAKDGLFKQVKHASEVKAKELADKVAEVVRSNETHQSDFLSSLAQKAEGQSGKPYSV